MFKLVQLSPEGSDCTAPYRVDLNGEYTVEEFIHDVLLNTREFGYIYIDGFNPYREAICQYRNGKLLDKPKEEFLKLKIIEARAHGGWSCMDYVLTLEIVNGYFTDVTEHYGVRLEDIYGSKQYVVYEVGKVDPRCRIAAFSNQVAALNECKYMERLNAKKERK